MDLWDGPRSFGLAALALLAWDLPCAEPSGTARGRPDCVQPVGIRPARIQWFGTLEQGFAEARRTGRPILLSAASPSCEGIPGKW